MSKIIELAPLAGREEKLEQISDYLRQIKTELAELVEEYEEDQADAGKADTLTEALDALADAYEMIEEVILDE